MVSCPDEVAMARWLEHGLRTTDGAELEAHVDRCAVCAELIALLGRATMPPAGAPAEEPALPRGVQPGDKLGRFSVLEQVGSGGMGIVYAACDPELNRKVAIKLLRPDHRAAGAARRRLLREAKALAKITHPNVISVYDVGTIGDDVFVAMEFIEGPSLREWLAARRRGWREIVDVFRQAARGLAAAHAAGLVHRDFKPSNVLVGDDGRVRVLDFGLARAEQESAVEPSSEPDDRSARALALLTTITRSGSLAGTPAYMSPEQIRGQRADARSDQFSLCVALYEALYGGRPFSGNSLRELASAIAAGVLGSERDVSAVPRWLRRLVVRGLAADPGARFASMDALGTALGRGVDGRRWLVPASIAVGVAALTSAGWLVFGSQIAAVTGLAPEPPDACLRAGTPIESVWNADRAAVLRAALTSTSGSTADAVDRVAGLLDRFAGEWARRRTETCRASSAGTLSLALYRRAEVCFERRRHELDRLVASVVGEPGQRRADDVLAAAPSLSRVAECTDRAALLASAEPAPPALAAGAARIETELGDLNVFYLLGKTKQVLPRAEAVVAAAEKLGHQPLLAEAYYRLGTLQRAAGDLDRAEATLYRAVWTSEASRNDTVAANAWIALLTLVGDTKADYEQAMKIERHAQAALDRVGRESQKRANLFDYMGSVRYRAGKLAEAESMYRQALAAALMSSPEEALTISHIRTNLAVALRDLGKRAEAIELLVLAVGAKERELGVDNPRLSATLGALATALALDGHTEAAIPMMERSLAIKLAAHGPAHWGVCYDRINLAEMQGMSAFAAQRHQSIAGYRAGIDCSVAALGEGHPTTAYALLGLGTALIAAGRADEAVAPLERALALRTARKETPPADIEAVRAQLARALRSAPSGAHRAGDAGGHAAARSTRSGRRAGIARRR